MTSLTPNFFCNFASGNTFEITAESATFNEN